LRQIIEPHFYSIGRDHPSATGTAASTADQKDCGNTSKPCQTSAADMRKARRNQPDTITNLILECAFADCEPRCPDVPSGRTAFGLRPALPRNLVRSWPHHSKLLHRALQARSYFVRDCPLRMNVGRNAEDKHGKSPEIAFERVVALRTSMD
jgi:hypothetical protein